MQVERQGDSEVRQQNVKRVRQHQAEQPAADSGEQREYRRFHQHLPHKSCRLRSQRGADGDLPRAAAAALDEQAGDVRADEHQQQKCCAGLERHLFADLPIDTAVHMRAVVQQQVPMPVIRRLLLLRILLGQRVQLRRGLRCADGRTQTHGNLQSEIPGQRILSVRRELRQFGQRYPERLRQPAINTDKSLRRDSHHRQRTAVDFDCLADDRGVAMEARMPQIVANHYLGSAAVSAVLMGREGTAQDGPHTQSIEVVTGYNPAPVTLRR